METEPIRPIRAGFAIASLRPMTRLPMPQPHVRGAQPALLSAPGTGEAGQ